MKQIFSFEINTFVKINSISIKKEHKTQHIKKPLPTKKVMKQIYEMKLRGSDNKVFYSGEGSHHPELVNPYIKAVRSFLSSFENSLTVCDLGCGDFNIGKNLIPYTKRYIAVDIVSELILYNKQKYKYPNLEFHCMDIAIDTLPSGDCVILRQVLQHLSNKEVSAVVKKLSDYKYIILTEHLPSGDFEANKDIISGQGIRLKKKSGIDLLVPPFNCKIKQKTDLVTIDLKNGKGLIETTLFQIF